MGKIAPIIGWSYKLYRLLTNLLGVISHGLRESQIHGMRLWSGYTNTDPSFITERYIGGLYMEGGLCAIQTGPAEGI